VLFIGMGTAVYSSIFFATPVLVTLKEREPRYKAHTQRVLAKRAALGAGSGRSSITGRTPKQGAETEDADVAALAGSAPKVGARPTAKRASGTRSGSGRGGRPGGGRPSGAKRR
jgi:preprotein translocase subunit SecF